VGGLKMAITTLGLQVINLRRQGRDYVTGTVIQPCTGERKHLKPAHIHNCMWTLEGKKMFNNETIGDLVIRDKGATH
jgi:hypothetical protein